MNVLGRTPWPCGLMGHVLYQEVSGLNPGWKSISFGWLTKKNQQRIENGCLGVAHWPLWTLLVDHRLLFSVLWKLQLGSLPVSNWFCLFALPFSGLVSPPPFSTILGLFLSHWCIYSRFLSFSTARGSCTGLVTVGLTNA